MAFYIEHLGLAASIIGGMTIHQFAGIGTMSTDIPIDVLVDEVLAVTLHHSNQYINFIVTLSR